MPPVKSLCFADFSPFVRYVGDREINAGRMNRWIAARDHRLYYCQTGEGPILLENNRRIFIRAGDLLLLPAGTPFFFLPEFAHGTLLFSVNFDYVFDASVGLYQVGTVTTTSEALNGITRWQVTDYPELNAPFLCAADEPMKELLHSLRTEYYYQRALSAPFMAAQMHLLLIRMLRTRQTPDAQPPNYAATLDKLIDYIKLHYTENISLQSIARYMGYHPDSINRLMRQHTGKTIYQYLLEYRITKASQLLRSTDLPIATIAEQTGFADSAHFSHVFRRHTGKAPGAFRNMG